MSKTYTSHSHQVKDVELWYLKDHRAAAQALESFARCETADGRLDDRGGPPCLQDPVKMSVLYSFTFAHEFPIVRTFIFLTMQALALGKALLAACACWTPKMGSA
jgi:hypothetical protein